MERCVVHGRAVQPVSQVRVLRSTPHPHSLLYPDYPLALPADGITMIYPRRFATAENMLRTAYRRLGTEAEVVDVRIRLRESPRVQYGPTEIAGAQLVYLHRLVPSAAREFAAASVEAAARRGHLVRRADTLRAHERLSVIAAHPYLLGQVLGLLSWTVGGVIYPVVSRPGDVSPRQDLWITILDPGLIDSARSTSGHQYQVAL